MRVLGGAKVNSAPSSAEVMSPSDLMARGLRAGLGYSVTTVALLLHYFHTDECGRASLVMFFAEVRGEGRGCVYP